MEISGTDGEVLASSGCGVGRGENLRDVLHPQYRRGFFPRADTAVRLRCGRPVALFVIDANDALEHLAASRR